MIKVLIVDDSKVVQELLIHIFSYDPEIKVLGVASSGIEAIELTHLLKPDVITMDFHMPEMNGSEATRIIMETIPTPIVIVSGSISTNDVSHSLKLLEDGALAVVLRPPGIYHPDHLNSSREMIQTVKLMSEIKVVKVFSRQRRLRITSAEEKKTEIKRGHDFQLIAIGASTGGPVALQKILSTLPKELPVPILIVQHIAAGFVKGFVEWLSTSSVIPLKVASDGEILKSGTGYIAPDGFHMGIKKGACIVLSNLPPENGLRPSVDFLFRSVAEVIGSNAIGILLTGMGKDGAVELKTMREAGAVTIAQDSETSIVFGMPGEAIKIGAAEHILPIEKISGCVNDLFRNNI